MVKSLPRHVRDLPLTPLGVGEVVVSDVPIIIHTTLGSCVSVTLHDPITKAGAMCHALMPEAPDSHGQPLRYVDRAVDHLLEHFAEKGIPAERLQVRVIGGAAPKRRFLRPGLPLPVGKRNSALAIRCLRDKGLHITSHHTGGEHGRSVFFVTSTGELFVRVMAPDEKPDC